MSIALHQTPCSARRKYDDNCISLKYATRITACLTVSFGDIAFHSRFDGLAACSGLLFVIAPLSDYTYIIIFFADCQGVIITFFEIFFYGGENGTKERCQAGGKAENFVYTMGGKAQLHLLKKAAALNKAAYPTKVKFQKMKG